MSTTIHLTPAVKERLVAQVESIKTKVEDSRDPTAGVQPEELLFDLDVLQEQLRKLAAVNP